LPRTQCIDDRTSRLEEKTNFCQAEPGGADGLEVQMKARMEQPPELDRWVSWLP